jgi:eukaryotic-like serine/threonine-protein kinase
MAEGVARPHEIPAKIGRHQVVGYLADGGMAEIFLGKEHDGRPVVIKRILPHLARQQNFVSMFIDEARIGSLVHHPNVVEVYELGQVGLDLFLVMEYLAGENTNGLMRRLTSRNERLPYALAAHIVAESAAGLQHAHELCDEGGTPLHLVHRDISLSNIFVTYGGEVKVLDFGIATAAHRLTRTATGQVKGKFSYMSPEQCRGEGLDLRSDIFSLGVVLFELTTQRRLFKRNNELMVLKAVTELPIPRPTREVPGYPPELEAICLKALAREKDDRYASAEEMRRDLVAAIARLGGGQDLRAPLAGTMSMLFPERVEEKRMMLSNIRANTNVDIMPAAEVDESVEVPQITEHSQAPYSSSMPLPHAAPRRWPLAVAGLAIAALGAAIYWFGIRDTSPATPPPALVQPAIAPPPTSADASTELVLHVESIPPGATLAIDGIIKGPTPYDLHLTETRAIKLELELAGHVTVTQSLTIDRAQNLLIPLPEAPAVKTITPATTKPGKVIKKRPLEKDPKDAKDPKDPFQRFD